MLIAKLIIKFQPAEWTLRYDAGSIGTHVIIFIVPLVLIYSPQKRSRCNK